MEENDVRLVPGREVRREVIQAPARLEGILAGGVGSSIQNQNRSRSESDGAGSSGITSARSPRPTACWSSQGDTWSRGWESSGVWKMSRAQIICIQVVPHFGGVEIMMSPSRRGKWFQRAVSAMIE
jgi:hypothetical protein